MMWILAQFDREEALTKGYWNLAMIALIGLIAVIFLVAVFALRRWKHRQLKAIDQDRAARRAGQSAGRVDAWQASAERYVDHDKLTSDDLFERDPDEHDDDDSPPGEGNETDPQDEEEHDPFDLFKDKPYQDSEDEDDLDEEDEDEDWDEDDKH